jgi:hypothetical protein
MPTFSSRKGLLKSNKKRKLSIQQSFQHFIAQEFVASNDANRGTNRATPNESMAETFDTDAKDSLDEQMVKRGCDNSEDGNNSDEPSLYSFKGKTTKRHMPIVHSKMGFSRRNLEQK